MISGLAFSKLEALGNDFMLIDARTQPVELQSRQIQQLADRRYGIGFDQLLVLAPADDADLHHLRVEIFNADGSEAEQCGNGLRAIALWLNRRGQLNQPCIIQTPAGSSELSRNSKDHYAASLPGLRFVEPQESLNLPELALSSHQLRLGNPHLVLRWTRAPTEQDLQSAAAQIEAQAGWRNRCNIGLVYLQPAQPGPYPAQLEIRVHERGAGATPACGSGACAAAASMIHAGLTTSPVLVDQPGGSVVVHYSGDRNDLKLVGPAREIYEGRMA